MIQGGGVPSGGKSLQQWLRRMTPVQAAAVAGLMLLLGNILYLANPPFWDDILGLHRQALFLARNHFDVGALMAGGDFWSGGAWVYKWNWPSVLYAVLYSILPPVAVHCVGHLLNMGVLAASAGCVFQILRQNGLPPAAALLWSFALICEPLTSAQGVSLGQEIFLLGCFSAFLLAFSAGRTGWCLGFLAAAALIKPAALIPSAAYSAVCLWDVIRNRSRQNGYRLAAGAGMTLLIFCMFAVDSDGASSGGGIWSSLPERLEDMFRDFPLLVILASAGIVGGTVRLIREGMDREYLLWLIWLILFFAGYLFYSVPLPRYAVGVVPVCMLIAGRSLPWQKYTGFLVLLAGIVLQTGIGSLPLPGHLRHSGEYLERNRAFLKQMALDREMCNFLEERCGDIPVVAKWPYVQMLAEPGFGYVRRPLKKVYCAGILPKDLQNVKKYPDFELAKIRGVYYIFVCNSFEFFRDFGEPLMPQKGDAPVWMPPAERDRGYFLVYRR